MTSERPTSDAAPQAHEELPRPKHLPLISARAEPPQVVPARMLNEVTYCERLMYLEWVQGEFSDNYFTVDGRSVHERADVTGGRLPDPPSVEVDDPDSDSDSDARPYEARSVWLTSENLGITAKIDVVEGTGANVVPIEYKRGTAPDLPEGAYLPERVQLCAHVLLLREQGFACEHAEIYFAKSKRRVPIVITEALIQKTLLAVRVAREVATRSEPPPPLDDSPKCRGCSLAGICLPDEVNLLRGLQGQPIVDPPESDFGLTGPLVPDPWDLARPQPDVQDRASLRLLYPSRDDRVPLYVQDNGGQIGLAGERLVIRGEQGATHVRLMNTSQVVVRGNVQLTTQAARALLDRGIPCVYLSGGGWYVGRLVGTDTNNVDLRMAQFRVAQEGATCVELARNFVVAKIRNSRTLLRRNHPTPDPIVLGQLKQLTRKAAACESLASLLGIEGAAAREYFQAFAGMFKSKDVGAFDFERRNRRPPRDPVNALLSFAYALLTKDLVIAVTSVGLEPLLGFYHQPRFGRPALALDLMEEFRPLIADSVVLTVINNGIVDRGDFTTLAGACSVKPQARKKIIEAHERRMDQSVTHPLFGYSVSYRRVLEVQARLLSRVLLGELTRYPAFITR